MTDNNANPNPPSEPFKGLGMLGMLAGAAMIPLVLQGMRKKLTESGGGIGREEAILWRKAEEALTDLHKSIEELTFVRNAPGAVAAVKLFRLRLRLRTKTEGETAHFEASNVGERTLGAMLEVFLRSWSGPFSRLESLGMYGVPRWEVAGSAYGDSAVAAPEPEPEPTPEPAPKRKAATSKRARKARGKAVRK